MALLQVQKAIYDALNGNAPLDALVTGVFDEVPQTTVPPFVQFGSPTEDPWHTFGRQGWKVRVPVYVWSEYPGNKESLTILDAVTNVLDEAALTITGHTLVRCRRVSAGVSPPDPDGFVRTVEAVYELWVQET